MIDYKNPWVYEGKPMGSDDFPEGSIGFVYEITNKITGRKYIGKKILHSAKKKLVNGKNKRYKVPSDWQRYYGSSDEVKSDLTSFGRENFERKILYICMSKSEMSYKETKEIFLRDALLQEIFYNHWVSCKIHKKNLRSIFIDECEYRDQPETGTAGTN